MFAISKIVVVGRTDSTGSASELLLKNCCWSPFYDEFGDFDAHPVGQTLAVLFVHCCIALKWLLSSLVLMHYGGLLIQDHHGGWSLGCMV